MIRDRILDDLSKQARNQNLVSRTVGNKGVDPYTDPYINPYTDPYFSPGVVSRGHWWPGWIIYGGAVPVEGMRSCQEWKHLDLGYRMCYLWIRSRSTSP